MWLSPLEIADQLRLDADHGEDLLLQIYSDAARQHISNHVNRAIYDTQAEIDALDPADPDAIALDSDNSKVIRLAGLLVIGHWYENRAATDTLTIKDVPLGFESLLAPLRFIQVG